MIKAVIVLMIIGGLLTEVSSFLNDAYPHLQTVNVQPFIALHWEGGFPMLWLIKYACDDLCWVLFCIAFCMVAYRLSEKLFIVACNVLLYHLIDGFMLWYNYKLSHWLFWVLLASTAVSIITMAWPTQRLKVVK